MLLKENSYEQLNPIFPHTAWSYEQLAPTFPHRDWKEKLSLASMSRVGGGGEKGRNQEREFVKVWKYCKAFVCELARDTFICV